MKGKVDYQRLKFDRKGDKDKEKVEGVKLDIVERLFKSN